MPSILKSIAREPDSYASPHPCTDKQAPAFRTARQVPASPDLFGEPTDWTHPNDDLLLDSSRLRLQSALNFSSCHTRANTPCPCLSTPLSLPPRNAAPPLQTCERQSGVRPSPPYPKTKTIMASLSTRSTRSSIPIPATSYVSIRRSSLLLLTLGSFAIGTLVANMATRSWRRVQRYIESRRSNGGRRPVIVCFGDSITQGGHSPEHVGWVGRLEDFYCRRADVLCRGFSGYNSDWLVRMQGDLFTRLFKRRPPALVTIWLGANDATVESSTQHVPLWKYKDNLEKMVRYFRRLGRRDRQVGREGVKEGRVGHILLVYILNPAKGATFLPPSLDAAL